MAGSNIRSQDREFIVQVRGTFGQSAVVGLDGGGVGCGAELGVSGRFEVVGGLEEAGFFFGGEAFRGVIFFVKGVERVLRVGIGHDLLAKGLVLFGGG